jgi:hypothetical protein
MSMSFMGCCAAKKASGGVKGPPGPLQVQGSALVLSSRLWGIAALDPELFKQYFLTGVETLRTQDPRLLRRTA